MRSPGDLEHVANFARGARLAIANRLELERLLVDLAASPEQLSSKDLNDMRRRIESRSLLFKVRVVSADIRQRQKAIVHARAQQRSSL